MEINVGDRILLTDLFRYYSAEDIGPGCFWACYREADGTDHILCGRVDGDDYVVDEVLGWYRMEV